MELIRNIKNGPGMAMDVFYPRVCSACGGMVCGEFSGLCWDCAAEVDVLQAPLCRCCGVPVSGRVDDGFLCHQCTHHPPSFRRARSAARYDGSLRVALMTFKYRVGIWMVPDLSLLLAACLEAHGMVDDLEGITWVPLHPARYRARGFNQAALLAYTLARRYGLPRPTRYLVRWRPTETETRLTAPRRVSNVEGAFWVPRRNRVAEKNGFLLMM